MTPRLLLIQIDGLSSARLREALARGAMPSVAELCRRGCGLLARRLVSPPSTPAFQAALLYGPHELVHGYTWWDRDAQRVCRFDVPEDIARVELELAERAGRPPLLALAAGTASYFLSFIGGAARTLMSIATGMLPTRWAKTGRVLLAIARGLVHAPAELARGVADLVRFVARTRDASFEWNWLAMRTLNAAFFEEFATASAVEDLKGGSPIVYLDFIGYDEAAHRRGPDHEVAFEQLRRIDRRIARLQRAARAGGVDVIVFSDHGQARATPFRQVIGRPLSVFVAEACVDRPTDERFRTLVARLEQARIRAARVRKWPRPLGTAVSFFARAKARRAASALTREYGLDPELATVTGGSIAHLYLGPERAGVDLETIERRVPRLLPALVACPAVGLTVVRRTPVGPLLIWRGRRIPLADTAALAGLEPFQAVGVDLLRRLLLRVVENRTAGDIVLYGAFALAGAVSFDPELGSHGGVHPDELDLFVAGADHLHLPLGDLFDPADLHVALRDHYAPPVEVAIDGATP